jgi:hypothetical protein
MEMEMVKQEKSSTETSGAGVAAAAVKDRGLGIQSESSAVPTEREKIARLAYSYWQERGCPNGSPEDDWFRAEGELQKQAFVG